MSQNNEPMDIQIANLLVRLGVGIAILAAGILFGMIALDVNKPPIVENIYAFRNAFGLVCIVFLAAAWKIFRNRLQ